jgi:hypothetical protein
MRNYKKEITEYLDAVKGREKHSIDKVIEDIRRSKYVCVFGAGMTSFTIVSFLKRYADITIDFLCDNDESKWGKIYHDNLMCISPSELERYRDEVTIVIATQYYKEIFEQLKRNNFQRICLVMAYRLLHDKYFKTKGNIDNINKNIIKLLDILEDEKSKQILFILIKNWFDFDISCPGFTDICSNDFYYPNGIIKLSHDEAFVDAGAYDGDTLLSFLQKTHNTFESIHAFELDKDNFKKLQSTTNPSVSI